MLTALLAALSIGVGVWYNLGMMPERVTHFNTFPDVDCDAMVAPWLGEQAVAGLHVMCLGHGTAKVYLDGWGQSSKFINVKSKTEIKAFRKHLRKHLPLSPGGPPCVGVQPWGMFSENGKRLETMEDIKAAAPIVLIMSGGQFIWPGIRAGYVRNVSRESGAPFEVETLSLTPLVLSIRNFLEEEECDGIISAATDRMVPSGVQHQDNDVGKPATNWRTSTQTFLDTKESPLLASLEDRVVDLTKIPRSHQESLQVLRYEKTQKYDAHHDFFDPSYYQNQPHLHEQYTKENRLATVFWYMSDVAEGGQTVFPRAGGAPQPHDFTDCSKGLRVKAEKGKAIIFYNMLPSGLLDQYSLHGGCPVKSGIKWAANKWVWSKPTRF